ncbi:MAG: carboxysome shell carbonic anhydrase [Sulfuritalea sp.]|nr:carboxysome shell carbonic anhydrase [Sulfuritalea sp.]
MPIHAHPIAERIDWLFDLASRHGATFRSPEASLARQRYLAEHPTAIAVLKCMDGRVNIPVVTNTPTGILMPFRNLGGMFDLGWPHLGEVLTHHVQRMVSQGRRVLFLVTYHFSKGDPHRGCAGFRYDTEAAIRHTYAIRAQMEAIFGAAHGTVYPLVCGLETDEDALIVHGEGGARLDMASLSDAERPLLAARLAALLPDMPAQMRSDLLPLLEGNLDRIRTVREQIARHERQLDFEHREWIICLGRGFDFLHTPNVALIIGPYSPKLDEPIRTAAGIIRDNMTAGRIPTDGFLLLASAPYDEIGVDRARAELKSRFLSDFAAKVIRAEFPEMADKMATRTAVLDWRSRQLETIAKEPVPAR